MHFGQILFEQMFLRTEEYVTKNLLDKCYLDLSHDAIDITEDTKVIWTNTIRAEVTVTSIEQMPLE